MDGGITYGYARVSAKGQNLARQYDALEGFPVARELIFADKASGKDFDRPAYKRLKDSLRSHDTVVIKSIDRLGRNYEEIIEEWRCITKELGCSIVVLDMPLLDTREASGSLTGRLIADIVLQLLSYVAQVERENIRQRQAEGIAAAKARGVKFGRPRVKKPVGYRKVLRAHKAGKLTRREAAMQLGLSISTLRKWMLEEYGSTSS